MRGDKSVVRRTKIDGLNIAARNWKKSSNEDRSQKLWKWTMSAIRDHSTPIVTEGCWNPQEEPSPKQWQFNQEANFERFQMMAEDRWDDDVFKAILQLREIETYRASCPIIGKEEQGTSFILTF
jgi:hypothetical protein